LIAPIGQTLDQAAPRHEQAGLFHIHVFNRCRRGPAIKERRSPDRRFEFSAKGAAFRTSLGQRPQGGIANKSPPALKARFNCSLFCFSLVAALKSELIRAFSAR
jgi:hypothetical protein